MVVQATNISKKDESEDPSSRLTSPAYRLNTVLEGDKYGVLDLVGKVEDHLKDKNSSLNGFVKNKKVNVDFDNDFETDKETGELFYIAEIQLLDIFFDRLYQRKDLFSAGNCIKQLDTRHGYLKPAGKPFIIFLRPEGCQDKDGVDMSGFYNPDGQHESTMAYIASGEDKDIKVTCKVYPFKKGTSLKRCREVESYIFDTMQDVTTMTQESRFKTKFYNPKMYGKEGSDAKDIGEWLWRAKLNCVDLFDKALIKENIDSIGAIKKAVSHFGDQGRIVGLNKLNPALEIYRKVFNKENLTVPAHTKTIAVHAVSGIAEVLDKFKTENGGQVDHQLLVEALVDWIHNEKEKKDWKLGTRRKVDRLTKIFAPHFQIQSVAYRAGVIYNNYLDKKSKDTLLSFIGGKSLRIKDDLLIELKNEMEEAVESVTLKSKQEINEESLKKAA
jgi:hypothetical protein